MIQNIVQKASGYKGPSFGPKSYDSDSNRVKFINFGLAFTISFQFSWALQDSDKLTISVI